MLTRILRLKLLVVCLYLVCGTTAFSQAAHKFACNSPEHRQFDFWIGDWDVFENDRAKSSAHVRVNRILAGCALRERYEDADGTIGESFSTYDVGRRLWHQTWLTNRGQLLTIEGGMGDGSMRLAGAYFRDNGQEVRIRGSWTPMSGTVRESAVTSSDTGKTWNPWFDLTFRPRRPDNSTGDDDTATVARLDEQFQAAVKTNDADTMDKIMAEDFVLVTGSGKVFNKEQSLDEARRRSTIYEKQDDSERSVRVWGDTAVVTAKLWIKGVRAGKAIDYTLWFSDIYVRTPSGWKYKFGQASLPLLKEP